MEYNYIGIFESLQDGVYFIDGNSKVTYWNQAAERITGFSADEMIGESCLAHILLHYDDRGAAGNVLSPLEETIRDGVARQAEVFLHHKEGHRVPVFVRATPLRDKNGEIIGGVELFSDISAKKAMQDKIRELEKLALIDSLTGLSNRKHTEGELEVRFHEKARYGLSFGVLFMDIDQFKTINDTYGHMVGDLTLRSVAAGFQASIRSYDIVGRWGGEEFVGIFRNVDQGLLTRIGERFRALTQSTPIEIPKAPFSVTISLGATIATDQDTPETLLKRADELLYLSKKNGRNRLTAGFSLELRPGKATV